MNFLLIDNVELGEGEKNFAKCIDEEGLLEEWIERHKGGSPTDSSVYWIHYRPSEIADLFYTESGYRLSNRIIKRKLSCMHFRYRKQYKNLATGTYADRNAQFEMICQLILVMSLKNPILSIDCKKKEVLGNLYRSGKCYMQGQVEVLDHDYRHLAEGKVIPHGIYDLARNEAYISIGTSHETAEFVGDNVLWWWQTYGKYHYEQAENILILCDSGGANSYRHHAFKKKMLQVARMIGKNLIICHYPPYASKWNPIEHRVFAHIHRAMEGAVFSDYNIVKTLIQKTTTQNGLKVFARIVDKEYPIGIKTKKEEVDFNRINFNQNLPELSYRIIC